MLIDQIFSEVNRVQHELISADGLWRILGFIKSIQPNYQLYIRHHSFFGDDTVLYAVPEVIKP